jgi:hypothetical protein
VYLNDAEQTSYAQEFREASDGVIELPRVISGYEVDNVARYEAINELALHYVNSHFVHPDDVLDAERGAGHDWAYLRDQYENYIQWVSESTPAMRNMTAREAAIAVQRYARLAIKTEALGSRLQIDLGNFADEAWLMVRTRTKPLSIDGGTITPIAPDLYLIQALKPKIILDFEGAIQ